MWEVGLGKPEPKDLTENKLYHMILRRKELNTWVSCKVVKRMQEWESGGCHEKCSVQNTLLGCHPGINKPLCPTTA